MGTPERIPSEKDTVSKQDILDRVLAHPAAVDRLIALMKQLRTPVTGCPWDLEQDFETIKPHTVEEAYEVAEAIENNDMDGLKDELGDLLLQVVFHAQIAEDKGLFNIDDVAGFCVRKMISRHPHVFPSAQAATAQNGEDVMTLWESIKETEKKAQTAESVVDQVTSNLPALLYAQKVHKKAARTGFDWSSPEQILDKMEEEIAEMRDALAGGNRTEMEDELGDMITVCVNLGRFLDIDCETAARAATKKFKRRFKEMEAIAKEKSQDFKSLDMDTRETYWQEAKKRLASRS